MSETTLTAIDGRDALAFVIVRPGREPGMVTLEAAANGMSKAQGAIVLRHIADTWAADAEPGEATSAAEAAVREVDLLRTERDEARGQLDAVYRERAHLVAHLTALYPSVLVASAPDAPEWAIVYVTLPTGQASWHIAVRDLPLFADVDVVAAGEPGAIWDGHSTDEKYRRLDEATQVMRADRESLGEIEAEAARLSDPLLEEY